MLTYFRSLKGDGELVTSFAPKSEVSFEIVRDRFLQDVELEAEWSVEATLYAEHDRTGRYIVCGEELMIGLEAWFGA